MRGYLVNLGDRDFLTYGGLLIFRGTRDLAPTAELVEPIWRTNEEMDYIKVYRFDLDRIDAKQFDNEWFAKDAAMIEDFQGFSRGDLRRLLGSRKIVERAFGYQAIADYHGYCNFDSDPIKLSLKEARKRYMGARRAKR